MIYVPGIGYDAQHGDGIDAGGGLLAGQLHHCMHHGGEGLSDTSGHSPAGDVLHPRSLLQHSPD